MRVSGMNKWLFMLILIIVIFQTVYTVAGFMLLRRTMSHETVISGWELQSQDGDLALHQIGPGESSVDTYRAMFTIREWDSRPYDHFIIMVGNLNCTGYIVRVNGHTIGCAGDIVSERANIWSNFFFYTLDQSILKQDNIMEIRAGGDVKRGLYSVPVIIGSHERMQRLNLYFDISNGLIITGAGMLLLSTAIALIIFSFTHKRQYFYLGMSLLCLAGSSGLFIHFAWIPVDFYTHIRIVYVLLSSVAMFSGLMLFKVFRYRTPVIISCTLWLSQILCQFIIRDKTLLYNVYRILDVLLLLCLLGWIILLPIRREISRSIEKRLFYGFVVISFGYGVFLLLSSIAGSLIIMLGGGIIFISFYVVLTMLLLYRHILDYRFEVTRREYKLQQLNGKIYTDVLTGLYNRRYMVERIKDGIGDCHMVVLDVDGFKGINDMMGHDVGDKVLIAMAKAMLRWRNLGDFIARWGGDEFVMVLHPGKISDSTGRLEELQVMAAEEMINVLPEEYTFSFSVGVLETSPGLTEAEAFRRADQALLYAKSLGNGNIIVWTEAMDCIPVRHMNIR